MASLWEKLEDQVLWTVPGMTHAVQYYVIYFGKVRFNFAGNWIGCLPDAVRPLYHLLRQRVTNARFTPASAVDARMKNVLPSGAYLPFPPISNI